MKFIHISDLHIGKRLYGFDLEDDQRHILKEIISVIQDEMPDGVLIAGDIYDRSDPSAKAVDIFDDFLSEIAKVDTEVFIISGNHDSASRIAYGGKVFSRSGIHIAPLYDGSITPVSIKGSDGRTVKVYLMPYMRADAAREALSEIELDGDAFNVLVSHQFVTSSMLGGSEEMNVGTLDGIDAEAFSGFDYVALGHLHVPQDISIALDQEADGMPEGTKKLIGRYCGSPLAYSFSEAEHDGKSITIVEENDDCLTISLRDLTPLHGMATIRGGFDDIMSDRKLIKEHRDDYVRVILNDKVEIIDGITKLRKAFPLIMHLEYESAGSRHLELTPDDVTPENKDPMDLVSELYLLQRGHDMSERQKEITRDLIKDIWEGDDE